MSKGESRGKWGEKQARARLGLFWSSPEDMIIDFGGEERGLGGGERKRHWCERNIDRVASFAHPDWRSDPQPFWCTGGASTSQATWPGQGQENSVFLTLCPEPYLGDLCSSIKHIRKFKVLGVIISWVSFEEKISKRKMFEVYCIQVNLFSSS